MKKSLLAIAVMGAFATAAQADSSVTVWGNIDVGLMTSSAAGNRTTGYVEGQVTSSQFGLNGQEDLGGGLRSGFGLSGGFNSGNGQVGNEASGTLFGRTAEITLGGDWGTVAAGLQFDPGLIAAIATDPRGMTNSMSSLNYWILATLPNGQGFNGGIFDTNAISYAYAGNGLYVGLLHGFGGVAGSNAGGSVNSIGATYTNSGLVVSGSYATTNEIPAPGNGMAANTASAIGGGGVGYSNGPFAVRADYTEFKFGYNAAGNNPTADVKLWGIGGDWTSGSNKLNLSYYNGKESGYGQGNGGSREYALLDTYSLSKRTSAYAQIASIKVDKNAGELNGLIFYTNTNGGAGDVGGGVASGTVTVVGVGIQHSF